MLEVIAGGGSAGDVEALWGAVGVRWTRTQSVCGGIEKKVYAGVEGDSEVVTLLFRGGAAIYRITWMGVFSSCLRTWCAIYCLARAVRCEPRRCALAGRQRASCYPSQGARPLLPTTMVAKAPEGVVERPFLSVGPSC